MVLFYNSCMRRSTGLLVLSNGLSLGSYPFFGVSKLSSSNAKLYLQPEAAGTSSWLGLYCWRDVFSTRVLVLCHIVLTR